MSPAATTTAATAAAATATAAASAAATAAVATRYAIDLGNVLYTFAAESVDVSNFMVLARAFDPAMMRKAYLKHGAFRTALKNGYHDLYIWAQAEYNYTSAECAEAWKGYAVGSCVDDDTADWIGATYPTAFPFPQPTLRSALEKLQIAVAEVSQFMDAAASNSA